MNNFGGKKLKESYGYLASHTQDKFLSDNHILSLLLIKCISNMTRYFVQIASIKLTLAIN